MNCIVCLPGYSDITEHPLLKRLIKGVFNMRPPQPRYSHTWDINIVFNYISNMGPNYSLSLKQISLKLVTLHTLLAIQRVETIPSFTVDNMILTQNYCTFQSQKIQGFCVADFATLSDERRSRSKLFPLFIWIKEPCVRKFEGLERSKLLGISQTNFCHQSY